MSNSPILDTEMSDSVTVKCHAQEKQLKQSRLTGRLVKRNWEECTLLPEKNVVVPICSASLKMLEEALDL